MKKILLFLFVPIMAFVGLQAYAEIPRPYIYEYINWPPEIEYLPDTEYSCELNESTIPTTREKTIQGKLYCITEHPRKEYPDASHMSYTYTYLTASPDGNSVYKTFFGLRYEDCDAEGLQHIKDVDECKTKQAEFNSRHSNR